MMTNKTIAPDNNLNALKLKASMASFFKAIRHKTELAAKAVNANPVNNVVLASD